MGGSVQTQPGIRGGLNGRGRLAQAILLVLAVACDLSFGDIRAHHRAFGTAETDNATDYRQNVAGGVRVPEERFPYVCHLTYTDVEGSGTCTGVLFHKNWIITAAHCVDPEGLEPVGQTPTVLCGFSDRRQNASVPTLKTKATHIHESWKGSTTSGYDIALLELDQSVDLPEPLFAQQTANFDEDQEFTFMATSLVQLAPQPCGEQLSFHPKDHIVCVESPEVTQEACRGDSGGPLIIPSMPDGNVSEGTPKLDLVVGIDSFGGLRRCDGGSPGAFTSIGYFWGWILDIIDKNESPASSTQEMTIKDRSRLPNAEHGTLILEAISSIADDNGAKLRSVLANGLSVQSVYNNSELSGYPLAGQPTLLHWTAAYGAVKCAKTVLQILLDDGSKVSQRNVDGSTPLHVAAVNGSASVARVLLLSDANVNAVDDIGATPLHRAAQYGNDKVAKVLIENGADIDAADYDQWTVLHYAAYYDRADIVQLLIDLGADVTAVTDEDWTALHVAARYGHKEIAKILLDEDVDVDPLTDFGWTPLHLASFAGHFKIVKLLLNRGADANTVDSNGVAPLHEAARYGHFMIAEILMRNGAHIDTVKDEGWTPLHLASRFGHSHIAEMLILRGADVDAVRWDGWNVLHTASRYGHSAIVKALVEEGVDVNVALNSGANPLHIASFYGHIGAAEILAPKVEDVDAVGDHGSTSLHLASRHGSVDIAKILIAEGADVNAVDEDKWTPLHYTARFGHADVAKILIASGAAVNAVNKYEWTPLLYAAYNGHHEVVQVLVNEEADVNSVDEYGWTPLLYAAYYGKLEIVKTLVSSGAHVNEIDEDKSTPLHEAAYGGHYQIATILARNGADINAATDDGQTPLHIASRYGQTEFVEVVIHLLRFSGIGICFDGQVLLDRGVDVEIADEFGWRALHFASYGGHLDVVEVLVDAGASTSSANEEGSTPLDLVCEAKNSKCPARKRDTLEDLLSD